MFSEYDLWIKVSMLKPKVGMTCERSCPPLSLLTIVVFPALSNPLNKKVVSKTAADGFILNFELILTLLTTSVISFPALLFSACE